METRENGRDPYDLPKVTHNITCLHSTSLNFISLYPTLPHPDSLNGLSTASLPPWGQSIPLYPFTFLPSTATTPCLLLEGPWYLHWWHILQGALPKPVHPCQPNSWAVQAHCLPHRHIFPLLSKALQSVHCTFIARPNNGAGFNILVFLAL